MRLKAPDLELSDIAEVCRRGENPTWAAYHVKTKRFEEFFRCVNEKMLAGEKTISQVELDAMAIGQREQPKPEPKRLTGPVEKPKDISIVACLEIVDGIESQSHGKDSITDDVCGLMRQALNGHRDIGGAAAISWERWNEIARASMDLAEGRRKLAIADRKLAMKEDFIAAIGKKLKQLKKEN
jgi:hypothetical protein